MVATFWLWSTIAWLFKCAIALVELVLYGVWKLGAWIFGGSGFGGWAVLIVVVLIFLSSPRVFLQGVAALISWTFSMIHVLWLGFCLILVGLCLLAL